MNDEQAEADRLALCGVLADAEALLRRHGETHWAGTLAEARRLIEARDAQGVRLLRSSFGGMGSFNDLLLDPINGHEIEPDEIGPANERLQALQTRIYSLNEALRGHIARHEQ